jgi:hypothetical protein
MQNQHGESLRSFVERKVFEGKLMTDTGKAFDPAQYLKKLAGKDYLEVKWRLLWAQLENDHDLQIETELHTLDLDRAFALFKARVTEGRTGKVATGWGSETKGDFFDYIEKAETKAVGRALGALGYGTQFADDWEFDPDNVGKVVDSPVEKPSTPKSTPQQNHNTTQQSNARSMPVENNSGKQPDKPTPQPENNSVGGRKASEKQVNYVRRLVDGAGQAGTAVFTEVVGERGTTDTLTFDQADQIIKRLSKARPSSAAA